MEDLENSEFLSSDEIDNLFNEDDDDTGTFDESKDSVNDVSSDNTESTNNTEANHITEDEKAVKEEYGLDDPESVGNNEEDNYEGHKDTLNVDDGSPTIYSSITNILRDEGVLDGLNEEALKQVKDVNDFNDVINALVDSRFDDRALAIEQALQTGIDPNTVAAYDEGSQILREAYDTIQNESDEADDMRERLIYQNCIMRGYSPERASREVEKSKNAMTDKEDAMEALREMNDALINEQQALENSHIQQREMAIQQQQEFAQDLYNSIYYDDFGNNLSNSMKNKIAENVLSKQYINPNTKQEYTALEKYATENPKEYLKNVGYLYTITNGFKNMENLSKGMANKIRNRNTKELESLLKNSSYDGGNLQYVSDRGRSRNDVDWIPDPT